jgi:adenylylsulfate kinase-like enzyme
MILNKNKFSIWLIGPSGAGKTTISKILYENLKINRDLILLDGDKIRNLYENNLGYDPISRSKNTKRYINLNKWLMSYNISSINAVISPFEKDRKLCRKNIENYFEIYLKSSREERIKRDKKKLYLPAINGKKKNVVDVDIPFEQPKNCDVWVDTEKNTPEECVKEILKKIKG